MFDIFIFTFVFESECFAPLSRHAGLVAILQPCNFAT